MRGVMGPNTTRFVFEMELGKGDAGIVYKALDKKTGDTIAVKQLFSDIPPLREVKPPARSIILTCAPSTIFTPKS